MKSTPPRLFRQAGIPSELAGEVGQVLRQHPELGFRTLSDFVRSATEEKLQRVHFQLGLRAVWKHSDLGADMLVALLRKGFPTEYLASVEDPTPQNRRE